MIRPATPNDIPRIAALIRELARYEKLEDEAVASEEHLRESLFRPGRPDAEALVAEAQGTIVGFAIFFHNYSTFLGRRGLYLEDLFVVPEERRKGYGKALLCALARIAVERGCGRFEWTALDWNQPAIDFYRALGANDLPEWRIFRISGAALERLAGS